MILDGKAAASFIKKELKVEVDKIKTPLGRIPHLAAVLIGTDGASMTYVSSKVRNCDEMGYKSTLYHLEETVTEAEVLAIIHKLNKSLSVNGILVQLPLPAHISTQKVIDAIHPLKDVDGFHQLNSGRMLQGQPAFLPATPYGILLLLDHYKIETDGKHAVVLGRSNIVGRPMSILLSRDTNPGNCTVTLCHSHTKNIKDVCLSADILISALGKPGFVTADMVKEGSVVIDVGITRIDAPGKSLGYRLHGDVDFKNVAPKAGYITPVPGGVGPMTITALLKNTFEAFVYQSETKHAYLRD